MEQFWVVNDPDEGARRHAEVLDIDGDVDPMVRAEALRSYASSADIAGQNELALELYERSLAIVDESATHTAGLCCFIASVSGTDATSSSPMRESEPDSEGDDSARSSLHGVRRPEADRPRRLGAVPMLRLLACAR